MERNAIHDLDTVLPAEDIAPVENVQRGMRTRAASLATREDQADPNTRCITFTASRAWRQRTLLHGIVTEGLSCLSSVWCNWLERLRGVNAWRKRTMDG